jgi:acetyl esterase/lipase
LKKQHQGKSKGKILSEKRCKFGIKKREKMSFKYKVLERCIKKINIKKIYDMPEEKMKELLYTKFRAEDLPEFLYKQFTVQKTDLDGRLLFKLCPKEVKNENVILFIHGGGGMMCPTPLHYRFAAKIVKKTGSVMYFPFYPLGPESSINQSMEWLDKAYEEILKHHAAEKITVIGDSAGAALSVSLCSRTRKKPAGLVLISPATGIDKDDEKMKKAEKDDIILSVKTVELTKKHWIKDAPLNGAFNTGGADYIGFPPIRLYYGTAEIFYPYIGELIQKIKNSGTNIKAFEGAGLCHDWVLIGIIPESRAALDEICSFVTANTNK